MAIVVVVSLMGGDSNEIPCSNTTTVIRFKEMISAIFGLTPNFQRISYNGVTLAVSISLTPCISLLKFLFVVAFK